jgi:hypothetical protein
MSRKSRTKFRLFRNMPTVVDLRNDRLLVHSSPESDTYLNVRELHVGEFVAPQALPECQLPVNIFLP